MKTPSLKNARREAGYTLFEIMLVLAIIAVLVSSAIFLLGDVLTGAKEDRVTTDSIAVDTMLTAYENLAFNKPTTEQGLQALVTRPTSEPQPKRWRQIAKEIPRDPWNTPYIYRNPGTKHPSGYDFYSAGPDHQPDTADDIWPSN